MKPEGHLSRWRSPEAEARFRAREAALVAELAAERGVVFPEPRDVATTLGPTRAYRWAPVPAAGSAADLPPVVLLHGTTATSLMWVEAAERIRATGRAAYGIDTIGDVGHSRQDAPVTGPDDLATWLGEALDGLGLASAHLAGVSYGGFLALNLAARRPERVRSLTVIEPAGVERVRMARFMAWGLASMGAAFLPAPLRLRAARRLRMPVLEDPRVIRLVAAGQRAHRADLLRPEPLTDGQLAGLDTPVLALFGERSEVFPAEAAAARVRDAVPGAEVEVVAGAGHGLIASHADLVVGRLLAFLATVDAGP